ncbi:MAG: polysaccharide biosynthesis/export family protein [Elusimicrobiaceae bacterium]|nr:polysaccharide biosynthesis/export family protein [Elusimicrobiaceae bacterium]
MKRLLTYILVNTLLLAACSSSAPIRTSADNAQTINTQEVLQNLQQMRSSQSYRLQPGDLIEIQVFQEESMQRTLRINSTGRITFPLVGTLKLGGLSIEDAQNALVRALTKYIKNPQVSILVTEYGNKTVYVLGQVQKPAAIQIPPEKQLTVLEAITSVGGFTDIANTSKVRILRLQEGKQIALDVDVAQITKQGNKSLDVPLLPGDVVFVPQSMF